MEAQPNPYDPAVGEPTIAAATFCEPKFLALNGRIGRLRYLAYGFGITLVFTLIMAALSIPLTTGFIAGNMAVGWGLGLLIFVLYIPLIVFSFGYAVRRLNDLNQSGWLSLLFLVPLVNLGLGLYLTCGRGTDGANKYGLPPPPNGPGVMILGLILPLLFTIGLVAAVAIPAYQQYAAYSAFEATPDTATDTITEAPADNTDGTATTDESGAAMEQPENSDDDYSEDTATEPAEETYETRDTTEKSVL